MNASMQRLIQTDRQEERARVVLRELAPAAAPARGSFSRASPEAAKLTQTLEPELQFCAQGGEVALLLLLLVARLRGRVAGGGGRGLSPSHGLERAAK